MNFYTTRTKVCLLHVWWYFLCMCITWIVMRKEHTYSYKLLWSILAEIYSNNSLFSNAVNMILILFKLELSARHKQLISYFRELAAYYQEHLIFKTFGGLFRDLTHKCFIKNESLQKHQIDKDKNLLCLITSSTCWIIILMNVTWVHVSSVVKQCVFV